MWKSYNEDVDLGYGQLLESIVYLYSMHFYSFLTSVFLQDVPVT